MRLASLFEQYVAPFRAKYQNRLLPGQERAIEALRRCRTPDAGEALWCCSGCAGQFHHPLSCGHRSCPQCQNHETTRWLQRQSAKLLPVDYFLVTFTLPYELRAVAWCHQKALFHLLLSTSASVLKDFALDSKRLGGNIGMTAVLHTHSRRLDFHPHCHVVVPGGGVDRTRGQWRKLKGGYLFNEFALAKVFRARFLAAMKQLGLPIPYGLPERWVVNCRGVGHGKQALEYLSRYLYRGVISERNILASRNGEVTFRYTDSATGESRTRTLPGEDFLWLVLQHVLPKGFRRARDYGFLHGNAKRVLRLVQLVLRVIVNVPEPKPRPLFHCPACRGVLRVVGIRRPTVPPG